MADVSKLKGALDEAVDDALRQALIRLIDERIALLAPQVIDKHTRRNA